MNLDDPRAVQQGDPHRVAEILSAFPAQCRAAQALRSEPPLPRLRPSLIIIAGMGGSASGATSWRPRASRGSTSPSSCTGGTASP